MSSSTTKIQESSFSKDKDTVTIGEFPSVKLWFDFLSLDSWIVFKSFHINFIIEMTNVSNNSIVFHLSHMMSHNDSLISSASNVDISFLENTFNSFNFISFHAGLKGTNWVNLSDNNSSTASFHSGGTSLTNITISADNCFLS
jgi:hypothetical protein